ncbi:MAG: IS66 family insertion sequence element accessory protein TnpB, partial [Thiohalocapsa sp.]
GARHALAGHKRELAAHEADATDTPLQQIAIGMLNDAECGHYLKGLYWDGSGLCLFAKRLERGKFVWPPIVDGTLTLTPAQMALLIEAMDWRRTVAPPLPARPMLV